MLRARIVLESADLSLDVGQLLAGTLKAFSTQASAANRRSSIYRGATSGSDPRLVCAGNWQRATGTTPLYETMFRAESHTARVAKHHPILGELCLFQ